MSYLNPTNPANWAPIDEKVRSGKFALIGDGNFFALAKWDGERWVHSSGCPASFEPTEYLKRERTNG